MKGDTRADIGDDELELWLSKIPTRNMDVILDNCHAGSGTRAVTPFSRPRSLDRTDYGRELADRGGCSEWLRVLACGHELSPVARGA